MKDFEYFEAHKEEFIKGLMARLDSDDYIFCDKKDCNERGDYIKCYFDISIQCDKYHGNRNNNKKRNGI